MWDNFTNFLIAPPKYFTTEGRVDVGKQAEPGGNSPVNWSIWQTLQETGPQASSQSLRIDRVNTNRSEKEIVFKNVIQWLRHL